jgi:hypothetical protein
MTTTTTTDTTADNRAGECLVSSFQATRQPLHDHPNEPQVTLSMIRVSHQVLGVSNSPTTAPAMMLAVELDEGNDTVSDPADGSSVSGDYDDDDQQLGIVQYIATIVHLFLIKLGIIHPSAPTPAPAPTNVNVTLTSATATHPPITRSPASILMPQHSATVACSTCPQDDDDDSIHNHSFISQSEQNENEVKDEPQEPLSNKPVKDTPMSEEVASEERGSLLRDDDDDDWKPSSTNSPNKTETYFESGVTSYIPDDDDDEYNSHGLHRQLEAHPSASWTMDGVIEAFLVTSALVGELPQDSLMRIFRSQTDLLKWSYRFCDCFVSGVYEDDLFSAIPGSEYDSNRSLPPPACQINIKSEFP